MTTTPPVGTPVKHGTGWFVPSGAVGISSSASKDTGEARAPVHDGTSSNAVNTCWR